MAGIDLSQKSVRGVRPDQKNEFGKAHFRERGPATYDE